MTRGKPSESNNEVFVLLPDHLPAPALKETETGKKATEHPTRREKLAAATVSVCGFLAFYLLSAGPVAGIHNVMKVRGFQKAVEVIYAPVVLLVKSNIEPFSSIMKWYVDLFR